MPSPDQLARLRAQIAPAAVSAERLSGIPAEFIAAQCILESGWLKHAPGNNCFGIKWYPGAPGRQLLDTHEWLTESQAQAFRALGDSRSAVLATPGRVDARGRALYDVKDWFCTFPSLADCFTRRALMFTEGRYAAAAKAYRETRDLDAFARAVGPVYATDPHYADAVLEIARSSEVVEAVEAASAV